MYFQMCRNFYTVFFWQHFFLITFCLKNFRFADIYIALRILCTYIYRKKMLISSETPKTSFGILLENHFSILFQKSNSLFYFHGKYSI